jgi:cysteine-S-conjugate beta-lyase
VANVARRYDVLVVADEIHADLVLDPVEHLPFALVSADARSRTVTLQSASKAFNLGGLRCGVMHFGSESLRRRFESRFPRRSLGRVSGVSAAATVAAWRHGDDWLAGVVDQLRENRDFIGAWAQRQGERVEWTSPQGTYLSWLRLPGLSDEEAVATTLLRRARVALSPGEDFGGPELRRHVRLNFATSPELLDQGLRRIGAVLETHPPTSTRPIEGALS